MGKGSVKKKASSHAGDDLAARNSAHASVAAKLRLLTTCLLLFLAVVTLSLSARLNPVLPGDLEMTRALQGMASPSLSAAMTLISDLTSKEVSLVIALTLSLGLWLVRKRWEAIFLSLTLSAGLGIFLLKLLVERPRPSAELVRVLEASSETSFPSGHVMQSLVLYGFLFYLATTLLRSAWRRPLLLIILALPILLTGPSRVYLGAHWASDVLGAYLMGGLWLVVLTTSYRYCRERYAIRAWPPRLSELSPPGQEGSPPNPPTIQLL